MIVRFEKYAAPDVDPGSTLSPIWSRSNSSEKLSDDFVTAWSKPLHGEKASRTTINEVDPRLLFRHFRIAVLRNVAKGGKKRSTTGLWPMKIEDGDYEDV